MKLRKVGRSEEPDPVASTYKFSYLYAGEVIAGEYYYQ